MSPFSDWWSPPPIGNGRDPSSDGPLLETASPVLAEQSLLGYMKFRVWSADKAAASFSLKPSLRSRLRRF